MIQSRNQYFLKRTFVAYLVSLVACCVLFFGHVMDWYWILAGIVEVSLFYSLSVKWEVGWVEEASAAFEHKIFWSTFIIRLLWILGYYWFTMSVWNTPWEQPIGIEMDSVGYYLEGEWIHEMIKAGDLRPYFVYVGNNYSDVGYPVFLCLCRFLFGDSIFLTRVPNALFDAWMAVLTYRLAKRNFGESVGRVSALFVVLMPMLIFYSGVTMKESLMLMLSMWAIERGDYVIRERRYKTWDLLAFMILMASVLLFRTALAWVIALAFICALVFSSEKVLERSRRVMLIFLILFVGSAFFGSSIMEQGEQLVEQAESTGANLEYRANRAGGNTLAGRLNKAVFAPLIFTIPFPTMVEIEGQNIQQLQNGGFFLKNILSFFCIFALFTLLPKKRWRSNVMIIAFLFGYLMVLAMSSFAHSGRFHHPVIPIEMIFAALGISQITNIRQAKWFDYFLILEFGVIIFWNWFKLRGRGVI